jgi:hypothetical protein
MPDSLCGENIPQLLSEGALIVFATAKTDRMFEKSKIDSSLPSICRQNGAIFRRYFMGALGLPGDGFVLLFFMFMAMSLHQSSTFFAGDGDDSDPFRRIDL